MTKMQKILAAMLVSLGMAHGSASAQFVTAGSTDPGTADGTATAGGQAGGNTTINSGYDDGTGAVTTSNSGNVVIQSLTHTGDGLGGAATVGTTLTVGGSGVTVSNGSGGPAKITGVANGTSDYDAVNYKQLKEVAGGVASVAAMANIPQLDQKKKFSMGAGVGTFQGQTASALGATVRFTDRLVGRASIATTSGKEAVAGVGMGYSW